MKRIQIFQPAEEEADQTIREATDWRHVVFLPFQGFWEVALNASIFLNAALSTYDMASDEPTDFTVAIVYYACEIMFFVDHVLAIMHRNMEATRKKRTYAPRNLFVILVDTITLISVYEIKYFLYITNYQTEDRYPKNMAKWKAVVRSYRLFHLENRIMNELGTNQLLFLVLERVGIVILLGEIFTLLLFKEMKKTKYNFFTGFKRYAFSGNRTVDTWLPSFLMMAGVVVNNWAGYVKPENKEEFVYFLVAMLFGFITGITLFLGRLIMIFKRSNYSYYNYGVHVLKIMKLLNEWQVDEELQAKTFDYYKQFYKYRKGIRRMPTLFEMLPPSLQKEVSVDIFWEALRHTHFFSNTDMSFKRSLSLEMQSEFLLPGEFLFRIGELKSKMIYLVSGVVQALSQEDDNSPLLSFSCGTVLGELACVMPCQSVANLRAVTYCEIHCLYLTSLQKVLLHYPIVSESIRNELVERVAYARDSVAQRAKRSRADNASSIKLLKDHWRHISSFERRPESYQPLHGGKYQLDYTVANLDLLVLSQGVELRINSICLTGKCPFVMDPDTVFRSCCDYIVLAAVVLQSIVVPQAAFFKEKMNQHEIALCCFLDAIYVFDIYLRLSTAVKEKNRLISDFRELVIWHLRRVEFAVDVCCILPIDYFVALSAYEVNLGVFKLPRLLKIYKIFVVLRALEENPSVNMFAVRIMKWFLLYLICIYWFTGILYKLSKFTSETEQLTVADSIMLAFSSYLGFGGSKVLPYSVQEMIAFFVLSIIGHFSFYFGIAELTSTMILKRKSEEVETIQWWAIKSELVRQKLETTITKRLDRILYFQHTVRGCQVVGKESIFEDAPDELRNEIVQHRIADCIQKVPLFRFAQQDVLKYICAHAEIKLVPAGAILMDIDVKSDTLYIIMRGYCELTSALPGDSERKATSILEIGATFPFLETMHDTFSFINVRCLTVVECLLINTHHVRYALQVDQKDYECYKTALEYHRKVYGSVLLRKGARLPPMEAVKRSYGKGKIFEYDVHDRDDIQFNEDVYRRPFFELGVWSFVRFFMMRRTIAPTSWPYVTWEVFRCSVIVIYIFALPMRFGSGGTESETTFAIFLVFDFITLCDTYVRAHCQFYDERGILISHPLHTAKRYIATALPVDALGMLQFHLFGLDSLFGDRNQTAVDVWMVIVTRGLLLYRPFMGLSYLYSYSRGRIKNIVFTVRQLLLILIFVLFASVISMMVMCQQSRLRLYCDNLFAEKRSRLYQFVYFMYTVTTCVSLTSADDYILNYDHQLLTIVILLPMAVLKWVFIVTLASTSVGGNVELTIYRDRMRNYLKFLKDARIGDEDRQSIVAHYEYIWKKTHGLNMRKVIKNFHPQLEQDLAQAIYINCLSKVSIFAGAHVSLFHSLAHTLNQDYYMKDSKIIRCNDIQDQLYFVHDGKVDVYIAGAMMCTLRTGGVLGCFSKFGSTRQTIKATASVHCLLLSVETRKVFKIVEQHPIIYQRFLRASSYNVEYYQETTGESRWLTNVDVQSQSYNKYRKFFKKILVFENHPGYRFFDYITNVHLYPLSSLLLLTMVFINLHYDFPVWAYYLNYTTDFIHVVKMIYKAHLIYIDPESGRIITDPECIRRRYLKSSFWFDFFTMLPIELVAYNYTDDVIIYNVCFLNRPFRFIYLIVHYYQCEERLLMKTHLKWTYMIYMVIFQLHLLLCLWVVVACPRTWCDYRVSNVPEIKTTNQTTDVLTSTILAYLYVVNIYTGTGLRTVMPTDTKQLAVSILMMIITQMLVLHLLTNYVSHLMVNKFNFFNFEVLFHSLLMYLQNLELSPFLFWKVRKYCLRLWSRDRGTWIPVLIDQSPLALKENVFQILYGSHINNHYLFADVHLDFVRQLVSRLERYVFTTDDCVVEKGDADCCMYFINTGEIVQFDVFGKIEHFMRTLSPGESFGETQGLICNPHRYTYRAKNNCEVLILNKNRWQYLLRWFPASRERIIARGITMRLFRIEDMVLI